MGDGNCLYRAFADQIYGDEENFRIVKNKCLDYIIIEREFFSQFIEGGIEKFDDYIKMKRINGVWGDDLEIQAMSEIYNRPVEIYSYSTSPIKSFHENNNFIRFNRETNALPPIRLAYHGRKHYNSLIPIDPNIYKLSILNLKIGIFEDKVLEKVKLRQLQAQAKQESEKTKDNSNDLKKKEEILKEKFGENDYLISRGNFIEKGLKDLDMILEEKFNPKNFKLINEIIENHEITQIVNDSETEYKKNEEKLLKQTLEQSKNEYKAQQDLAVNYNIQFIVDMGFLLEDAVMAYSAVGDDPDLMLQYLYSLNNKF